MQELTAKVLPIALPPTVRPETSADISSEIVAEFADFMRQQAQAVDTHNRKIKRLRKIFDCLKDYYSGKGILVTVQGQEEVADTTALVFQALRPFEA